MGIFRQIPPTASFPIYSRDFLSIFKMGSLEEDIKNLLPSPYARITCSGTVALYVIIETLKDLSPKRTIIIPSFICPLVALAIARAGLKIVICDIQAGRFDYDLKQLEKLCLNSGDILAVIIPHLGGLPANMKAISQIVKKHGIYIVEDCAQALSAEYDGRKVGTFGEFAFFSLCRGKGLTLYEGGVLVTHQDYSGMVEKKFTQLVKANFLAESMAIIGFIGYSIFYRPSLFWFIFNLPRNFWNLLKNKEKAAAEYNRINFPIYKMSRFRKALGHAFFHRLAPQIIRQRNLAEYYIQHLEGRESFRIVKELPGSLATYPYVTLIFPSREKRDNAFDSLNKRGLGAFIIYIHALTDYPYMRPYLPDGNYPNASLFADCSLTLSTNIFLTHKDLEEIIALLTHP